MSIGIEGAAASSGAQAQQALSAFIAASGLATALDGALPVTEVGGDAPIPAGALNVQITRGGSYANLAGAKIVQVNASNATANTTANTSGQAVVVGGSGGNTVASGTGGDLTVVLSSNNAIGTGGGGDRVLVDARATGNTVDGGSTGGSDVFGFTAGTGSAGGSARAVSAPGDGLVRGIAVDAASGRVVVTSSQGGQATLSNVEYVELGGGRLAAIARSESEAAIARLYQAVLGRTVDQAGFDACKALVDSGRATVAQVAEAFVTSQEGQARLGGLDAAGFVGALYTGLFDRAPDAAGLASWAHAIASGQLTRADVAAAFATSREGIEASAGTVILNVPHRVEAAPGGSTVAGSAADEMLVGSRGSDLFVIGDGSDTVDGSAGFDRAGVAGPAGGFAVRYEGETMVVTNLATARETMLQSVEYFTFGDGALLINAHAPDEAVIARMYEAVFDRGADAGLGHWWSAHESGLALRDIAASFLGGAEFQAAHGPLSNAEFVALMYENTFGHPPDAAGYSTHLARLESGSVTRADLVVSFASSAEAEAKYAATVHVVPDTAH